MLRCVCLIEITSIYWILHVNPFLRTWVRKMFFFSFFSIGRSYYSHILFCGKPQYVNDIPGLLLYTRMWKQREYIKWRKESPWESLVNDWARKRSAVRDKAIPWFYRGGLIFHWKEKLRLNVKYYWLKSRGYSLEVSALD